jgi:hypothetical protein
MHAARAQEVPALFLSRNLTRLAFYNGSTPWANGTLTIMEPVDLGGSVSTGIQRVTEPWAAYLLRDI